jgi:hypothetical protein
LTPQEKRVLEQTLRNHRETLEGVKAMLDAKRGGD